MKTFLAIFGSFQATRFQFYVLFDLIVFRFPDEFSIGFPPRTSSVTFYNSFGGNRVFLCPKANMMDSTLLFTEVLNKKGEE